LPKAFSLGNQSRRSSGVMGITRPKYLRLFSKDTYLAFAKDFNCDYVLVDSDKLLYDFPVIYQNDKYSVQQFK
jgi:hypothetical protein